MEIIIFLFLVGWMVTDLLSKGALLIGKIKLLKYLCQKCLTFWIGLGLLAISNVGPFYVLFYPLCASFIAYCYELIKERIEL